MSILKPLTSLRFVFAYKVFAGHLGGPFLIYNGEFLKDTFARYLSIKERHLGVSFFFILSGFILSFKYKEAFLNGSIRFKNFILSRIFRIYPLHIITFCFAFYLSYYINPLFRVFDFIIGIVLHDLYMNFKDNNLLKKHASLLEISTIILFLIFYSFHVYISQDFRWSIYYLLSMALLIFIFFVQNGLISKFLSKRVFIWLGVISFAFYILHQLVIEILWILNYKFRFFENGYLHILLAFILSIIASGLLYKYFEKSVNKCLRKKYINQ